MAMLELKNVHAHYGKIHALKDVSIKVNKGEIVLHSPPIGNFNRKR